MVATTAPLAEPDVRWRRIFHGRRDLEAAASLQNATYPERGATPDELIALDERRDPSRLFERWIAHCGATPVAVGSFGELTCAPLPGRFFIDVLVRPDQRGRGIGSRFVASVGERLRKTGAIKLIGMTSEAHPEGVRFLERRGFRLAHRAAETTIDPSRFDPAPYRAVTQRLEDQGFRLCNLTELRAVQTGWAERWYALQAEIAADIPYPEPVRERPFEVFMKTLQAPTFSPHALFFAIAPNGELAGLTHLWLRLANPTRMSTGLTGVRRAYRRRGIALALKVRSLAYAKELGITSIDTNNEEHNPMLDINLRLGFRPQPALLEFRKELTESLPQPAAAQGCGCCIEAVYERT